MAELSKEKQERLEQLQWRYANKKLENGDEAEMNKLTEELREARELPDAADSGVLGDENHDGQVDDEDKTKDQKAEADRSKREAGNKPKGGFAGVTTTKDVNKG